MFSNIKAIVMLVRRIISARTEGTKLSVQISFEITVNGDIAEDGPADSLEVALSGNLVIAGATANAADSVVLNTKKKIVFVRAEGATGDIELKLTNVDLSVGNSGMIYFGDEEATTAIDVVMDSTSKVYAYLVRVGTDSTLDMQTGSQMIVAKEVLRIEGTLNVTGEDDFEALQSPSASSERQLTTAYTWVRNDANLNLTNTYMSSYSQFIGR